MHSPEKHDWPSLGFAGAGKLLIFRRGIIQRQEKQITLSKSFVSFSRVILRLDDANACARMPAPECLRPNACARKRTNAIARSVEDLDRCQERSLVLLSRYFNDMSQATGRIVPAGFAPAGFARARTFDVRGRP